MITKKDIQKGMYLITDNPFVGDEVITCIRAGRVYTKAWAFITGKYTRSHGYSMETFLVYINRPQTKVFSDYPAEEVCAKIEYLFAHYRYTDKRFEQL